MVDGAPMIDRLVAGVGARAGGVGVWFGRGRVRGGRAGVRPAADTCSGARSAESGRSCLDLLGRCVRGRDAEVAEHVLEAVVAEHRALEARGTDVDAEQVEQVVGPDRRYLVHCLALDLV